MGWAIDPQARPGVEVDPAVIRVIADWLKERGEEGWGEVLTAAADKLASPPMDIRRALADNLIKDMLAEQAPVPLVLPPGAATRSPGLCPHCTGELAVRAGALLWHVTCRRCGHSAQHGLPDR